MPRPPRNEPPSGVFHITCRGAAKTAIFHTVADRRRFLRLAATATADHGWHCLAYCLMGNHYHLLIETTRPTLGRGMKTVNGRYAQGFNRRYGRSGHLFGARYHAVPMTSDPQVAMCMRYIALNPVRAGLVTDPRAWPWSSHAALLGDDAGPSIVDVDRALAPFGAFGPDPRVAYAAFVASPDPGLPGT